MTEQAEQESSPPGSYPLSAIADLVISNLEAVLPDLEAERQGKIEEINALIACNPAQLAGMRVVTLDDGGD